MVATVLATGLQFPEGPALDRSGNLYVVEIGAGQIVRIGTDGGLSVFAKTGGGPNGSAFGPDGNLYVTNNGGFAGPTREPGRLERVSSDGRVVVLLTEIDRLPLHSPNDLAFDAHGNLYFTDPVPGERGLQGAPPGSICFTDLRGAARRLHTGLAFPNGIGVSDDGRTLIVCESVTGKLHAFPIHEPGVLGEPRVFATLPEGAIPDGFAFDEAGNVLCCGFRSARIHVFPPEGGERLTSLEFDDPGVTNVCFGGPDFRTLFVTESRMGRVVSVPWERPGMRLFPDR
jgi:gluconolactonase